MHKKWVKQQAEHIIPAKINDITISFMYLGHNQFNISLIQ